MDLSITLEQTCSVYGWNVIFILWTLKPNPSNQERNLSWWIIAYNKDAASQTHASGDKHTNETVGCHKAELKSNSLDS